MANTVIKLVICDLVNM